MEELQYSILRYAPSLVSGKKINLAAVFYYPDTDYRDFFSISNWSRIASFDDSLCIPILKDLMLDIRDEIGTTLTNPNFDLQKFCSNYHSELYFDTCTTLYDVSTEVVSSQIDEIKRMYFQFEFEQSKRPSRNEQKQFLRHIFKSKQIKYDRDARRIGAYDDSIVYDYIFDDYGVVFFNLNYSKIDNKIMNKVKAWAWNCQNSTDGLKIIILYDLADINRPDVKPALNILKVSAYQMFNIHDGFSDVSSLLDRLSIGLSI